MAVSTSTPIKQLKRAASEMGIDTTGFEKQELVAAVKKARCSRRGFDWSVDLEDLCISVNFELTPLPHDERVYLLRKNQMNFVHEPDLSEKLRNVSKEDFLNAPEWKTARETAEANLSAACPFKDAMAAVADSYGMAAPIAATVQLPVYRISCEDEDESTPLDPSTTVLTLGEGKTCTVFDGSCHTNVASTDGQVSLAQLMKAIEKVSLEAKIVEHAAGKSVDTDHSVCELSSVSTTSGVAIKIGWGS